MRQKAQLLYRLLCVCYLGSNFYRELLNSWRDCTPMRFSTKGRSYCAYPWNTPTWDLNHYCRKLGRPWRYNIRAREKKTSFSLFSRKASWKLAVPYHFNFGDCQLKLAERFQWFGLVLGTQTKAIQSETRWTQTRVRPSHPLQSQTNQVKETGGAFVARLFLDFIDLDPTALNPSMCKWDRPIERMGHRVNSSEHW